MLFHAFSDLMPQINLVLQGTVSSILLSLWKHIRQFDRGLVFGENFGGPSVAFFRNKTS